MVLTSTSDAVPPDAPLEPETRRQTKDSKGDATMSAHTFGQVAAVCLVGFGMNGREYNGTFRQGLSFSAVCFILAIPAGLMVPLSWMAIEEEKVLTRDSLRGYLRMSWGLLRSRAFFFVVLYQFLTPVISDVSTTAGGLVKNYWAGVQNLQNQIFSLVGLGLFAAGLALVRAKFLNKSWRMMLLVTTLFVNLVDMPFVFLTVFNIVRNQYFYLGETVLIEIPAAANFVVSTFVIVEMAEDGNEGLVYGLLTTMANLGEPVAAAVATQLFAMFRPSLSAADNYIRDTPEFRSVVASSFGVSYAFSFLALTVLLLLPDQKEEAQLRKRTWEVRGRYAAVSLSVVALALVYSLSVNSLSLFESTMCLKFIGGEGCDEADQQAKASVPIAAHTRYAANHTANGTIELARGALLY